VITLSNLVGRRAAAGLIAAALLVMGGAGCSGAASSAPPAPPALPAAPAPTTASTSAELCTAVTDFRTSAAQLTRLDAAAVGPDGVKAALRDLGAAASEVADAAAAEFGPESQNLNEAISALGSTIESLQGQADLASKLGAITRSVGDVQQAVAPIVDKARTACPSDSTPPTT
jgi:predicted naringenin-chalcone synthase